MNNRDGNRTQNFLYDPLNRIQQANSSGSNWGETFTIDAWGNLTNKGGLSGKTNTEPLSASATVQNRLTGFGYDAAGNMISNGSATYVYDAENRLIAAGGQSYKYDGDGKRVEKCTESTPGLCTSNATATKYWMGWTDDVSAETDLPGNVIANYVFFNGQRIARRDASTGAIHYYFSDHLGTHSLVTDANGTMPPQEESDFYPYGGEIPITSGDTNHYKFTGKERDAESGLDNFGARYNTSNLGRFMTPDWAATPITVPYAKFGDPQTLNLYAYVENAPVNRADADGHQINRDDMDYYETPCTLAGTGETAGDLSGGGSDEPKPFKFRIVVHDKRPSRKDINELTYFYLGLGHHGLPRALFRYLERNSSAYRWLNNRFVTGQLEGEHYYDAAHRAYNKAVQDLLKLDTEEGQAEVANDVMKAGRAILNSDNPQIKGFLDNMKTADGMTGREALGRALEGDADAAGEFISGAIGELIGGAAEIE